jgi:predicted DNA-binding protein
MYYSVNGCKQLSRTVSARIPAELHEELRERCNLLGESISDYVKAAIEFALYGSIDFDFGGELVEELEEKRKIRNAMEDR